jgi:hypothetical protein
MKRTFYVSYLTYDLSYKGSITHTHIQLEEGQKANENTFKEIIDEKTNGIPHPFEIFHCSRIIAWSLIEY